MHLALRQQIYESEELIDEVYFPLDCVRSAGVRMKDGSEAEVGTIGREGMSAFPLLTGASSTADVCYCQVRGNAIDMPAALFRELSAADSAFRQLLDRYLQAYINMLAQLGACNRLHTVYERKRKRSIGVVSKVALGRNLYQDRREGTLLLRLLDGRQLQRCSDLVQQRAFVLPAALSIRLSSKATKTSAVVNIGHTRLERMQSDSRKKRSESR